MCRGVCREPKTEKWSRLHPCKRIYTRHPNDCRHGDYGERKRGRRYQSPGDCFTGFLGSGKTTLLNHILTATHGKKIAVIENEFGDVGIDDALLQKNTKMQSEEEIIEMMNGCICCTVRQDLVKVLEKLADRVKKGTLKLDGIIIETTGVADPAPVAQTFFVDDTVKEFARLDGIVTLVDAKHIEQHLDDEKEEGVENEAVEQVAFADRLLICKLNIERSGLDSICMVIVLYKGVSISRYLETARAPWL